MTEVVFPPLSKEDESAVGVVANWYVDDGDPVRADEVIAEVQVDKVSADVVAPVSGTLRWNVAEEAEVRQGSVIATIS